MKKLSALFLILVTLLSFSPAAYAKSIPYAASQTETYSHTVYITRTGKKYHRSACRYLRKSKIAVSLVCAKGCRYTPCSVCDP